MEKKGQVTIFIIIAILIVVMGVLAYLFFPQIKSTLSGGATNPQIFIEECIEEEIADAVEAISLHGGSIEPEFFSIFNEVEIRNLCYTAEYCALCSMQEPQLKPSIEREIQEEIEPALDDCFDSLVDNYKNRGYTVLLTPGTVDIELLPQRVVSTFDYDLTLTKEDTETYDSFSVVLNNNLYELISIANSILTLEAALGSADVTVYMDLYSHLKVEERLLSDGTNIYIITDRNTGDKFQFASRSMVLSGAGYC